MSTNLNENQLLAIPLVAQGLVVKILPINLMLPKKQSLAGKKP